MLAEKSWSKQGTSTDILSETPHILWLTLTAGFEGAHPDQMVVVRGSS